MPVSAAIFTDSVRRSSFSAPTATYSAVAGTPARRHSTTGLRPSTSSGESSVRRPAVRPAGVRPPPLDAALAAATARLCAGWYLRSSAFGVAPRPSSPRRR
jgi:hypothetical protein